jgi:arginyl-tRNA synthetase
MTCMPHDPFADFDAEIRAFLGDAGVDPDKIQLSTPADRQFGERATNAAMRMAGALRRNPLQIAEEIAQRFDPAKHRFIASVEPAGKGFINFRLDYDEFTPHAIASIREGGSSFGGGRIGHPEHVVVEHTSVNPNKEWHIGHVRNAILGDVVARVLRRAGHAVEVQNYIDDTGLQAAQAVLGLRDFPEPRQPDEKYDHYVGRLYVKIAAELAAEPELRKRLEEVEAGGASGEKVAWNVDEEKSIRARLDNIKRLQKSVMQVMHQLEEGEYYPIVERILDAQLETAFRLGVYYSLLNWESHLVQSRTFDDAMARLEEAEAVSRPDSGYYAGALVIQTGPPPAPDKEPKAEVLIRSSGLPTYVAKDIAYHMWKFRLLPDRLRYVDYRVQPNNEILRSTALHGSAGSDQLPDRVINVIAVNQSQAQDAVKQALRASGFQDAADKLVHLAYGLVSTQSGRISGRKGTGVSGDSVIDEAVRVAYERVREKRSADLADEDMRLIAEAVGIGAVRYLMVQYNPMREIVFDVADVVSFDGNTGLYIQYALVRMFAILRRASEQGITDEAVCAGDARLLQHEQEKRLILQLAQFPDTVATASRTLAVNLVAEFAFDLATIFSQFYRDCGVLNAEPGLREARLLLVRTVRDVLANACRLLGVPVIERL